MTELLETLRRLHSAILKSLAEIPLDSPLRKQLGDFAKEIYEISVQVASEGATSNKIKPGLWNRIFEVMKLLIPFLQ